MSAKSRSKGARKQPRKHAVPGLYHRAEQALQAGRLAEARPLWERVCSNDPANGRGWLVLGAICGELGDAPAAEKALRHCIQLQPESGGAQYNLGNALQAQGKYTEATASYRRALAIDPSQPAAWLMLGNAEEDQAHLSEALTCYRQAIALDPAMAEAHCNLGKVLRALGRKEEAEAHYAQALRLRPGMPEAAYFLSLTQMDLGKPDEALGTIRSQAGDGALRAAAEASVLEKLGRYEEAYACIRSLVDAGEAAPPVALAYARLCRRLGRCAEAVAIGERVLSGSTAVDRDQRIQLHMAMGEACDHLNRYDQAFTHIRQGNKLKRDALGGGGFDRDRHRKLIEGLIAAFSADGLRALSHRPGEGEGLVFVVGMPRSGTSLVEQILASHPSVHACGELPFIAQLAAQVGDLAGDGGGYPRGVSRLSAQDLDRLAHSYLAKVGEIPAGATRVTDKMPDNFLHLGLIGLLFPQAKVLHCVRDPLDTCLSCHVQNFDVGHAYAYDLADLGFYYREYARLMEHWRAVRPLPMLDVRYEDLVAALEDVSRRILDFCGLPWDERCLDFHRTGRLVNTASYDQVRRPVYSSSVGRWRHYEKHLGPLIEALGDAVLL